MRISRHRPKYKKEQTKRYRTNQYIRVPEVRVIDDSGGNLGVMPTPKALALAQEQGLDLVEVSPLAKPPVVRIINYNKLKYQEEKDRRKERAKQKKVELKGLRLSLRISDHDLSIRAKQAQKFLTGGDKVRIELILKGRERQHLDLAKGIIKKFIESLKEEMSVTIEQPLSVMGGKLSVIISPS